MARSLTLTRRTVPPDEERSYLADRTREAGRFAATGDHLWIFHSERQAGVYLEFRESGDAARLTAVDPSAELWTEVELA